MMDEIQGYPRFLCFFWRVHGHLPGLLGKRQFDVILRDLQVFC